MKHIFTISIALCCALSLSAAEQKIKFACIGDSITYGSRLENREADSYPSVLGRILGDGFEVVNFGVSGATASAGIDRSYAATGAYARAKEFAPDIVTIMLGTNDAKPVRWNDREYALGLRSIVEEVKSLPSAPRVILLTPIYASDDEGRDSLIRQPLLKVMEWMRDNTGAELLDMYWPLREEAARHLPDRLHPDPYLDSLIAARIAHNLPLKSARIAEHPYIPARQQDVRDNVAQWRDYKFGMFIHWGIYSQRGIIESWSLAPNQLAWCYRYRVARGESFEEYARNYAALKWSFNPVAFDPSEWARAAKNAGMKYVVFTTKHHDGFCMFDTGQTDYKVTDKDCPFSVDSRANIAKEVFDAFRKEGLVTGAYFSVPDWHNEDYWFPAFPARNSAMNYDVEQFPDKWQRYNDYVNAQLDELTTGYGPLNVIWFDVPGMPVTTYAPMQWERFEKTLRGNQPGIMMVARGMHTIYENYRTPEQTIPSEALDYPWESCITMTSSWAWRPESVYKSTDEILTMLVQIVSRGGNLLLNVGPRPDGTLDVTAYERLEEIGGWMDVNGEGIYGTKPYKLTGNDIYGTTRNGVVYAFHVPSDESTISVSGVSPKSVSLMGYGRKLRWSKTADGFTVTLPEGKEKEVVCLKICAE